MLSMLGTTDISGDTHPDMNACRARLSLALRFSDVELPWKAVDEVGVYMRKLGHVSMPCRIEYSELETSGFLDADALAAVRAVKGGDRYCLSLPQATYSKPASGVNSDFLFKYVAHVSGVL